MKGVDGAKDVMIISSTSKSEHSSAEEEHKSNTSSSTESEANNSRCTMDSIGLAVKNAPRKLDAKLKEFEDEINEGEKANNEYKD